MTNEVPEPQVGVLFAAEHEVTDDQLPAHDTTPIRIRLWPRGPEAAHLRSLHEGSDV